MAVYKRVNLAFTPIEYEKLKKIAKKNDKRPGAYCRKIVLDTIGIPPLEVPEKGFQQLNIFQNRKGKEKK